MYKACYYANSHLLKATVSPISSYIWTGILTAKDIISEGFRWVLGDREGIEATRDPWLKGKPEYRVNQNHSYTMKNTSVSKFFLTGSKCWDANKVHDCFLEKDAKLILSTRGPQNDVKDKNVWTRTTNDQYSVKTRYHRWRE